MKLGVVGSRGFNDYELMDKEIKNVANIFDIDTIISGGAMGADRLSETWAKKNDKEILIFYPDWEKFGKGAGMIRNRSIVSNSDVLIAFWDGASTGTKNSIDRATKRGIPLYVVINGLLQPSVNVIDEWL
jgi:predicted Rossmann fold nucleotide-binding protein DprA/Smf involved in DNA uptake